MYLVFDIGGTKTRIGISSDGQALIETKIVPTPADFETGIQTIKQVADDLSHGQTIKKITGGIAGPLNQDKSMLIKSPHISSWIGKPLKERLENIFNATTFLENDAILAGLGEACFGVGKNYKIVAYLTISTGVGGAKIVEGKVDQNTQGFEPGHQIIKPDGIPCKCGGIGHLETLVGGSYIQQRYGLKAEEITDPAVWDEIVKFLAIGLHNTIVHWSPEVVILGGSVSQSIPLDKLLEDLTVLSTIFPRLPKVSKGSLGDQAGLLGALKLLR
ncbi:hypothetical protein A3C26_04340 [Candidatus Daviesbacteria bacterium RIFCSPHIGHO2_02_FULL_39_12]|nr:MAG: hypothetical protein A3C26_04340 [Candidatus Daviesbacteria bacterium RIFCSPHIGHO2_02_FULL_39_12]